MAEDSSQSRRIRRGDAADVSWSQIWHLPVLLLGLGLFVIGVYLSLPDTEENDFTGVLDEVGQYFKAGDLEAAQERLTTMQPTIQEAQTAEQARFWQYWGDLNYLQTHQLGPAALTTSSGKEVAQRIVRYYDQAEELGRTIDPASLRRYAQTLVALGKTDEALAIVDRLADAPPRDRYRILASLIEQQREADSSAKSEQIQPLIQRFRDEIRLEPDATVRRQQEVWITTVQSRMRLEAGDPQRVIDELLVRLQRLTGTGDTRDLVPLHVLLAKAYQQVGDFISAERLYRAAQQQIDPADGLNADIHVGLGEIALSDGEDQSVERALEQFSHVVRSYPSQKGSYVDALIGKADCEALLQAYPESVEDFRSAVAQLLEQPRWHQRKQRLTDVVRAHLQRAVDQQNYDLSLDYLTIVKPLHQPNLPTDLLLNFAVVHEQIADQRRAMAQREDDDRQTLTPAARRLANQEAATHYAQAADYYLQHARAVTITDDQQHGQSLWKAAICYDAAEQWKDAIDVYAEFVRTRESDPRRLSALNHLAKAYLADEQYEPAIELFLQLLDDHPHTLEAYDSLVPLARAYMAVDKTDAAERTLLNVVTDHEAITPESEQYEQALIALGKLYYRLGEKQGQHYVSAIERLTEAVKRYGNTQQGPTLRFLLADAYRKSVRAIDEELTTRQAQSDRLAMQAQRQRRLEQAQAYYNQVLTELEGRDPQALSPLERLYLRNSYFYQADAAFDRQQYELAINLYDVAARRWKDSPASLVALVQIVNANCEIGQYQAARVANERARRQLARMPDDVFDDPTLPMSRQHWEDWLRWTSQVELFGSSASAGSR